MVFCTVPGWFLTSQSGKHDVTQHCCWHSLLQHCFVNISQSYVAISEIMIWSSLYKVKVGYGHQKFLRIKGFLGIFHRTNFSFGTNLQIICLLQGSTDHTATKFWSVIHISYILDYIKHLRRFMWKCSCQSHLVHWPRCSIEPWMTVLSCFSWVSN